MTEQLSEQKQRRIYEWWGFRFDSDGTLPFHEMYPNLRPLYMPDGKESWNFVRECIEKLHKEGVSVTFVFDNCGADWYLRGEFVSTVNPAFFVALSELLEGE